MGIIPEENEEKWGTGKFEDLTVTANDRPDIEELQGYQGPSYDDDLTRETRVIYEENEQTFPPEVQHQRTESSNFEVKEVN
jgi:hypothetical protein